MSPPSLGVVSHVYREAHTLPTFLDLASAFFDEIVIISTPPSGAPPDEETIQIAQDFGARVVFSTIDAGFGVVRTRCIRESGCGHLCILDADEHIAVEMPSLTPHGDQDYPQHLEPGLTVSAGEPTTNQRDELRRVITSKPDAVRMRRRHWFGAPGDYTKPCQSWVRHLDYQLRCVANSQFLYFDPEVRMHEQLKNSRTAAEPSWVDSTVFIEHCHMWAKGNDPEGRAIALKTYEKLCEHSTESMWTRIGFAPAPEAPVASEEPPTAILPKVNPRVKRVRGRAAPTEGEATAP